MNNELLPLTNHLSPALTRWQTRALIIGVIFAVLSIIGAFLNRTQFFHSYLFAWLFWVGIPLGALVIVMMQALTGGVWGMAVRNLSMAAIMTLPLLVLLFIPLLIGMHDIYAWSNGILTAAHGFHHKQKYLNVPFFTARSIIYFVLLLLYAFGLRRHYRARPSRAPAALSASGLIVYVLCMNFASTDWVMSLDPNWFSTVFVTVFMSGQFLAALSLTTALLCALTMRRDEPRVVEDPTRWPFPKAFRDLGNMLLAFIIFWIYVSFSQLLITWSGNLPKEISWYLPRAGGGWQWLGLALVLGEFLLPFFLLLSREAKRKPSHLAVICLCVFAMNIVNTFWLVTPPFHPSGIYVHWLDVTEFVALGGFWCALFFHLLKQRPLLPAPFMELLQHG